MSRKEPQESKKGRASSRRGPVRRFAGTIAGVVLFVLALPFLLLAGWGLLFSAPTLAVVAFTAAWVLFPLFNRIKAVRVLKLGASFVLIPAALALAPLMMHEVNQKVAELSLKPRRDIRAFTLQDRLGIYGLNIVMGVVGYPFYPEASKETLLMVFDPGPTARRVFYSDFGLGSRRVKSRLRDFLASLRSDDTTSSRKYGPTMVQWTHSDYTFTRPEARYALALNQTWLTAKAERCGQRWRIDVRDAMDVRYAESAYVTLVSRPPLAMEEGLFWVLQDCGWLHPYTAEFRYSVYSDDPRLN
ncbi:MAG TPA: hypothetical protein VMH22_11580 [bacterium]|nr:hypothetical protein [bacterium]